MLTFKQFLMEGVVHQVQSTMDLTKKLAPRIADKGSGALFTSDTQLDTLVTAFPPQERGLQGAYRYATDPTRKLNKDGRYHVIKVFTTNPAEIGIPGTNDNSTLRHELQHRYQITSLARDNPGLGPEALMQKSNYSKFDDVIPLRNRNWMTLFPGPDLSYKFSPREVNARGIQGSGDAIIDQNRLARMVVVNQPTVRDFEFNFEKSGGKVRAPQLPPDIGRWAADAAFRVNSEKETKNLASTQDDIKSGFYKKGDATELTKAIAKTQKAVNLDIAKGVQSNVTNAQNIAQDQFSDKVIGPQRERATRVANTQAEVESGRAKYGGFQVSPFLSDPLSTANMAADMAGALGDVNSRSQLMTKASASLNNPNFSDSEQMMGDAFLRGGGEDFQVDPRSLQVANQRAKDRLRDNEFKYNSFERR